MTHHDPTPPGADATGTHPTGADPTGAELAGADPTRTDPTGADRTDHDPTDHDPTDHDPTDHDPTDHVGTVVAQWTALRPDRDLTGMAVFGRVARLARLADLRRAAVHDAHGLQPGDVDVLSPLWREGDLRPLDLRRAMMIGSGTLTARLDRLEAAGLLERQPDPGDRRGRVLHLTSTGARLVPEVVGDLLAVENDLLAALPPTQRDRLARDLGRLLESLEDDGS